jgi:hypothetical protein
MSVADALAHASAKPAGKRPYFLNPETERVLAITMAAVQELAVARTRIDTLERLLEQRGILTRADIDSFVPDKEAAAERGAWVQEYLVRVLRIVQQEGEAAAAGQELASEELAKELAGSHAPIR